MYTKEEKAKWLDSAQVVLDALHEWGKQPYIMDYSAGTYSKFNTIDFERALETVIKRGREELRPKFNRLEAELQVWKSGDFPGMYRATYHGSMMGPYATKEQALDALEAVFNAEAK